MKNLLITCFLLSLVCNSSFGQTQSGKNTSTTLQPLIMSDTIATARKTDTIPHLQLSHLRLKNIVFVIEDQGIAPRKPPELPEPKFEE